MKRPTRIAIGIIIGLIVATGAWLVYEWPRRQTLTVNSSNTNPATTSNVRLALIALDDNGKTGPKVGCGDSLVMKDIQATHTAIAGTPTLAQTLEELFAIQQQTYSGYYNALYQSELNVLSATVKQGQATVALEGTVTLGGECDNPRFEQQILGTITAYPGVTDANVTINNKALSEVVSLK